MISVIIPTYNDADSVVKTVDSVLASKDAELEIIIVNDGSTDNTQDILLQFATVKNITIINQQNKGSNSARNRGFAESHGELVIFLDADAELDTYTLAHMKVALENSTASFAYVDFQFGFKKFETGEFNGDRLRNINYIHTSSLIKRVDFPGFDEEIKRFQDWDLWLTMLAEGKNGLYVEHELIRFSTDGVGISSWVPKGWYNAPFKWLPWVRSRVQRYEVARAVIANKHKL